MRQYELDTLWGLSKQSWLVTRQERERFGRIIRKWRKENPKSTTIQEMLAESLIRFHIMEQRLIDRRILFDGTPTNYEQIKDHEVDVESDDLKQKQREFDKMMPQVMRWKIDLLKLAMANDIRIDVTGDVSELFAALDKKNENRNGSSD